MYSLNSIGNRIGYYNNYIKLNIAVLNKEINLIFA